MSESTGPAPGVSETTATLPSSETVGAAPAVSQTWLPPGMVPKFPPRSYAILEGVGTLRGDAVAVIDGRLVGVGALGGMGSASAAAILTGSGLLRADRQAAVSAVLTGTGVLSGVARARVGAVLTGSGLLKGGATPVASSILTGTGALEAGSVPAAQAKLTGTGTLSGTAALGFIASRINKSGAQAITGTLTQLTSWTVDGAYPGTTIVSNSIQVQTTVSGKTISGAVAFTSGFFGTGTIEIRKNGTLISGGTFTGSQQATVPFSLTGQSFTAGDLIGVWVKNSFGVGSVNAAGTYLRIDN